MLVKFSFHCRFWLSHKKNTHESWKCLSPFSRTDPVKKFHVCLSISAKRLAPASASLLLEKQQKAGMKNVYFLCCAVSQVLQLSDLDVLRLLLRLWLRWRQTRTRLSVFLVYALVLLYFWSYWKLSVCCAKKPAIESWGFFYFIFFHSISSQMFQMTVSHQAYIFYNLHSCCRGNYHF